MNTNPRTARQRDERPVVGKDVLELLSTAMYVDPLTIYREYVQNAADAIDAARAEGVLATDEVGSIRIAIDPATRTISIRDNGSGLGAGAFWPVLTAIGASSKRGTGARGFRGVGRLSGLAYARELTFRSTARGEGEISSITWDCRALRSALRGLDDERELADVVGDITRVETSPGAEVEDHYFEVVLSGVPRQGDDRLMSAPAVADYLAQIAPVPLSDEFSLAAKIGSHLPPRIQAGALEIVVDGGSPLRRPFADQIPVEGGRPLELRELQFLEVPGIDGGLAAVAWLAHHDYEGAVHPATRVRGLRARVGDVQVGDGSVFEDVFPESRFNAWTVGEVHILDERITPNGRRDDFERNVHLANLKNHLAPLGREVANRCRTSSRDRKRLRDIELEHRAIAENMSIIEQGSLGDRGREGVALSVDLSLMRLEKLVGTDDLPGGRGETERQRIEEVRARLASLTGEGMERRSPLDHLPAERRAWYEEMFAMIYECSANRSVAKSLVDRMLLKLG